MEVGSRQGKTPIFVKDVPGFFVNRCLSPFMSEVSALILEGVDLKRLDKEMKSFGMPVGPITLSGNFNSNTYLRSYWNSIFFFKFLDEVGIDVSNHVGLFMSKADLGVRMQGGDPLLMAKMVEKGWLGRKAGKGFYLYPKNPKKGAPRELNPEMLKMLNDYRTEKGLGGESKESSEDIQMRIISRFINEAAFCLQDDIIRSPVDGTVEKSFNYLFYLNFILSQNFYINLYQVILALSSELASLLSSEAHSEC